MTWIGCDTYIYIHTHVYTYIHTQKMYIHTYMHSYEQTRTIYMHTYMHTHITQIDTWHTHTHAHIQTQRDTRSLHFAGIASLRQKAAADHRLVEFLALIVRRGDIPSLLIHRLDGKLQPASANQTFGLEEILKHAVVVQRNVSWVSGRLPRHGA
jgi:hypothetical protein